MRVTTGTCSHHSLRFLGTLPLIFGYSLETVLLPAFVTQMLAPSNATPKGNRPTPKVSSTLPSLARSLVTSLLPKFATQMLTPSKARLEALFRQ